MNYTAFHQAIGRIPVASMPAGDRYLARFGQFCADALFAIGEAAAQGLPLSTQADVHAVLATDNSAAGQATAEVSDAICAFLNMVRGAPFGMNVLGAYWSVHGPDAGLDVGGIALEKAAATAVIAALPAGFTDVIDCQGGPCGRFALDVLRRIAERGDIDIGAMELEVRGTDGWEALLSGVAVIAACFVHDRLPAALEVFDEHGQALCRLEL